MSVDECPYCGKPFKRLKSHLPHCKMAPAEQPQKNLQRPQDLSPATPKQKIQKKISATEDRRKEDKFLISKKSFHNVENSLATTDVTLVVNTERPKSKWLAKRQKEHMRLQQLSVSQKSENPTSLSDHEEDKSLCEITNKETEGAPQTNKITTKAKKVAPLSEHVSITKRKNTASAIPKTPSPSEWSLCHENPKLRGKVTDLEEIEPNKKVTDLEKIEPNTQSKDFNLVSKVKHHKSPTFITSKTSVWDHIKDSLYYKRSCYLLVPCPILETPKAFALETKDISATVPQSNKLEATKVSFTPSVHFSEASVQRPLEDTLSSRLQSVRSLGWNPEIMTAYNSILFNTEPLGNSSDKNMWKKHQFSGPLAQSKAWLERGHWSVGVPIVQRKLGDVRLSELGIWFGARSPKTPREIVTMFNQGWQWYYRKYIDVRRGGISGISLLFAGYCVLCYLWRYPHLKKERWRKYH